MTTYQVLQLEQRPADSIAELAKSAVVEGPKWEVVREVEAPSPAAAIKAVITAQDDEGTDPSGTYAAVPVRNWFTATVEVKTERKVTVA